MADKLKVNNATGRVTLWAAATEFKRTMLNTYLKVQHWLLANTNHANADFVKSILPWAAATEITMSSTAAGCWLNTNNTET